MPSIAPNPQPRSTFVNTSPYKNLREFAAPDGEQLKFILCVDGTTWLVYRFAEGDFYFHGSLKCEIGLALTLIDECKMLHRAMTGVEA